jgi:hypothetical protein
MLTLPARDGHLRVVARKPGREEKKQRKGAISVLHGVKMVNFRNDAQLT